ncbi:MAG: cytochrome c3 family protein, partial [bacterium]|nr:cytochrome c3 family protein [bacterium]
MKGRYVVLALFILFMGTGLSPAHAGTEPSCLECHGSEGLDMTFKNGEIAALFVDYGKFQESIHSFLECAECHTGFSEGNHPERTFSSKQEFSRKLSQACTNCHSGFTGIHKTMLEHEGTQAACSDCHRAHEVQPVAVAFSDTKYCIGCHRQNLALPMRDGETLGLAIETTHLEHSVHKGLNCSDCHFGFSSKEHPERSFQSKRDYTLAASETCRRCHFDKYTRTLESIHYQLLTEGRQDAPVCVDCHGAHGIATGRVEKIVNAKRCEQCHGAIYSIYKDSVHGAALISEHNQDVPVCSDCHRAHDISDPRTAEFHLTIPEICGNCHASPEIMDKYHLSTKVVDTYIQDFHGVTLRYYKREGD